ncbi:MAG: DUF6470 family protein [Thermacetogeniaceae bacterium]
MAVRLLIDEVWGRIGISQTFPFLRLEIADPKLKLRIEPPLLAVTPDRVELSIDATACRADLNQYDPPAFARVYAERAREIVEEAIAQIAEEGDLIGAIEMSDPGVFAELAREKGMDPDVDVELVPRHLPDIDVRIIKGSSSFKQGRVAVELSPGSVGVELQEGVVRSYLRQPPELHIYAVGSLVDVYG